MDRPDGSDVKLAARNRDANVVVFPSSRTGVPARICGRCMARNSSGETFCKVCGEALPEVVADVEAEATRRLTPAIGRAHLVIIGNPGSASSMEVPLDKDVSLVGRSSLLDRIFPDVDLAPFDPENHVSRRHAFIVRRHGGFAIEDIESMNGTLVNGIHRLLPHVLAPLSDGDTLTFGQTRCTFKADPPE